MARDESGYAGQGQSGTIGSIWRVRGYRSGTPGLVHSARSHHDYVKNPAEVLKWAMKWKRDIGCGFVAKTDPPEYQAALPEPEEVGGRRPNRNPQGAR